MIVDGFQVWGIKRFLKGHKNHHLFGTPSLYSMNRYVCTCSLEQLEVSRQLGENKGSDNIIPRH